MIKVYRKDSTWKKARAKLITSSDIPVLLGVGYTDPYTLFHQKMGNLVGDAPDMEVRFAVGHALEPLVDWFACERLGIKTINPGQRAILTHDDYPWAGSTVDRLIVEDFPAPKGNIPKFVGVLEAKTVDTYVTHRWDDGPAQYALTQLLWQLQCCDVNYGVAAAILGLSEFKAYEIDLDDYEDLADEIMDRAWEFHRRLITDTPPLAGRDSIPALKSIYPKQLAGKVHIVPPEQGWREGGATYGKLKAQKKELAAGIREIDKAMKGFEAHLMQEMEDAELVEGPGFTATWKQQTRKATEETQFRVLRVKVQEEAQ